MIYHSDAFICHEQARWSTSILGAKGKFSSKLAKINTFLSKGSCLFQYIIEIEILGNLYGLLCNHVIYIYSHEEWVFIPNNTNHLSRTFIFTEYYFYSVNELDSKVLSKTDVQKRFSSYSKICVRNRALTLIPILNFETKTK